MYDASIEPSEWPVFLKKLSDVQGGASIGMVAHNSADNSGKLSYSVLCDPIWQMKYEDHLSEADVFVERLKHVQNETGVWQGCELIDDAELVGSEFYTDWLSPQDLFHTVHCVAMRGEQLVVTLGAGRPQSAGHFNQSELQVWELLIPHIRRSVQIQKLNADLTAARNVMDGGLSRRSVGLILTTGDGAIADINGFADQILAEDDGLTLRAGKLVVDKKREQDRLDILLRSAANIVVTDPNAGGGFLNVSRRSGREPYKVLVTPALGGMPFFDRKYPAAAVYLLDPEKDIELNLRELQQLFDLTYTESTVAASIIKGMDVNETATTLRISSNTVRTHLKRVFAKTGTKKQSQLVLKILSTLP